MIRVTSNSKEYLKALAKTVDGLQQVTAATLTDTAEAVTLRSALNVRGKMIVRTDYTTRSLVTYKASAAKPIKKQNSVSGTKSEYLPIQDEGGTIRARKKTIAIPTNRVRGKDRKKKVPAKYRMDRSGEIQWKRPYAKGAKFFALYPTTADVNDEKNWMQSKANRHKRRKNETFGRRKGKPRSAYRLSRPAIFTRQGKKLIKVRDVSQKSVRIKARRWHTEAVAAYGNYEFMARRFMVNARKYLNIHID